jgi:Family of unknown function (DUF6441)
MRLRATVTRPEIERIFKDSVAKDITAAMRRETRALEKEYQAQVVSSGLSMVLAKTWNSVSFPRNKDALSPAGLIWSKAPLPMRAFVEGATIVPKNGRYLAIPTPWNRQGGRRGAAAVVTPAQMVAAKGQAFIIKSKRRPDVRIWALRAAPLQGRQRGRLRYAVSAGRLINVNTANRRAAAGIGARNELLRQGFVPMFVLVPRVVIRKRLDLAPAANAALSRLRVALADAINAAQRQFR